jgi:hypothetical protein
MRRRKLLLVGGVGFCAALMFAQTLPPMFPSAPRPGYQTVVHAESEVATRIFYLKGKKYMSAITLKEAKSGLEWEPSSSLPLSLAKAEEIARRELHKLVSDDWRWQVTDFGISRFRETDGWYFALTLKEPEIDGLTSDSFTVLMNSSGEPGRIGGVARTTQP